MAARSGGRAGTHRRVRTWQAAPPGFDRDVEPHRTRSEEHTSELQSRVDLVCRLLLEKKKRGRSEPSSAVRTIRLGGSPCGFRQGLSFDWSFCSPRDAKTGRFLLSFFFF